MNARISAQELFDQLAERLALRWAAGRNGAPRVLESGDTLARRPSLAGYLNIRDLFGYEKLVLPEKALDALVASLG